MCGIGGMLGRPDEAVLHRINRLQRHRGPDGDGVWADERVGLAHTRLAILDLDGGQQPIVGQHGAVAVVNGEIYNHLDLRAACSTYRFQRKVDSEVVLALHAQAAAGGATSASDHAAWIRRLDGMYAFALWDAAAGHLILARDPMGIKPLVMAEVDGGMIFASEMKGLRAHEDHVPRLDEGALALRLAWEYPLDMTTLIQGTRQVRPGTVEVWTLDEHGRALMTSRADIERQHLAPATSWDPHTEAPALLESFIQSVEQRLMADVPVGIVLSGGLDSALVAAVAHEAAERAGQPVPEVWTVAGSEDNPDWKAAEAVASALDLKHHQHLLDEGDFDRHLPNLVWHGEDLDTSVMFFQPLFQTMASSVKVGLCGQGADELHAGYPRYRDPQAHAALVRQRLEAMDHPAAAASLSGALSDEVWIDDGHVPEERVGTLQDMLGFELEHGQLSNFQLRLVDRHSMAHGLEVRVPFLGAPHREAAHRLPMTWRLPESGEEKAALRRAADLTKLPKDIVRRPKLPAGTATAPNLLREALSEHHDAAASVAERYPRLKAGLAHQPDVMLGLALFEAVHLVDGGRAPPTGSVADLLEVVA
ncbi:MAG: asparagine synthase (glutamine-hydrolyzing) [Candidatus Poseidoniaceae archaeon]